MKNAQTTATAATARMATTAADTVARLKSLAHLKIHPRDLSANTALVARAERIYQNSLDQEREAISTYLANFEAALNEQHPEMIEDQRQALENLLDAIEQRLF